MVLGERERVGLLLLQLFPNGEAADIVFVTVLHSSWDSKLRGAVVAAQCRTDTALMLFWRREAAEREVTGTCMKGGYRHRFT